MTQVEKIKWNVSKHLIEQIVGPGTDFSKGVGFSNKEHNTLDEIRNTLGNSLFEKLMCKIMEESIWNKK
jgi:hypothetical protein